MGITDASQYFIFRYLLSDSITCIKPIKTMAHVSKQVKSLLLFAIILRLKLLFLMKNNNWASPVFLAFLILNSASRRILKQSLHVVGRSVEFFNILFLKVFLQIVLNFFTVCFTVHHHHHHRHNHTIHHHHRNRTLRHHYHCIYLCLWISLSLSLSRRFLLIVIKFDKFFILYVII